LEAADALQVTFAVLPWLLSAVHVGIVLLVTYADDSIDDTRPFCSSVQCRRLRYQRSRLAGHIKWLRSASLVFYLTLVLAPALLFK